MKHFVYVTSTTARIIAADTMPQIMPYTFDRKADAEAYRRQLEAHYGFPPTIDLPKRPGRSRPRLMVYPGETIYESAAAAAKALGVSASAISQHVNNPYKYQSVKGYKLIPIDKDGKEIMR